jgi:hypothetical protein
MKTFNIKISGLSVTQWQNSGLIYVRPWIQFPELKIKILM